MSSDREALRAHRAALIERAGFERAELGELLGELERPLLAVDRGVSVVQAIRKSRWLGIGVGAAMAALAVARPRSILGWVVGGRAVWRLLTRVRSSG